MLFVQISQTADSLKMEEDNMSGKHRARGTGSFRQRQDGRWEGRISAGVNPATGRSVRKSFYGSTLQEVRCKVEAARTQLQSEPYRDPRRMSVGEWLDLWLQDYLINLKPLTAEAYSRTVRVHLKPALGDVRLDLLSPHMIQHFISTLSGLSPSTVSNIYGVLHAALRQAVANGYLLRNPADPCILPRMHRREFTPLDDDSTVQFLNAIQGLQFEKLFTFALFTGLRMGECLGLTWDCVHTKEGYISVEHQLQYINGSYTLIAPKSGKSRMVTPAATIMNLLEDQRKLQEKWKEEAGDKWDGSMNLVFTTSLGRHLVARTVENHFKKLVRSIGMPALRFHDLRHSFAVASLRSGDDVKTVQENLGHASAAFTLDVYGHVTPQMRRASAARMEAYIQRVVQR